MKSFIVEPLSGPLSGRIEVPGDKSIGHRALLFGGLCDGEVEVSGLSGGQDNTRTRVAMESMGVTVNDLGPGRVRVAGVGLDRLSPARGAEKRAAPTPTRRIWSRRSPACATG